MSDLHKDIEAFLTPKDDRNFVLARPGKDMASIEALEDIINDKSYQEAITGDPATEKARTMAMLTASVVGSFYKELIASGMPHDYAQRLTDDFWGMVRGKLQEGFDRTPVGEEEKGP